MDSKLISADFNIEIRDQQPFVTRNIKFKNGDTVSFSIMLSRDDASTISDIHKRSAEHVIDLLRSWAGPR